MKEGGNENRSQCFLIAPFEHLYATAQVDVEWGCDGCFPLTFRGILSLMRLEVEEDHFLPSTLQKCTRWARKHPCEL